MYQFALLSNFEDKNKRQIVPQNFRAILGTVPFYFCHFIVEIHGAHTHGDIFPITKPIRDKTRIKIQFCQLPIYRSLMILDVLFGTF